MHIFPYIEEENLHVVANLGDNTQYYSLPDDVRATQVATYYCPSHRSPPQLSLKNESRGGTHKAGALNDYAMSGGDGTYSPFYTHPDLGNGMARTTHRPTISGYAQYTHSGVLSGTPPRNQQYTGWKIYRKFRQVTDGLSNTFLAGEKFVPTTGMGDPLFGDGSFYNDDGPGNVVRQAGPSYPILPKPDVSTIPWQDAQNLYGSVHASGVCLFVLADASVRAVDAATNTTVLGYLSHIHDGQVIEKY